MKFFLIDSLINPEFWYSKLENEQAGGLVVFEGRVRKNNHGKKVVGLNYQSHPTLARQEGERILTEFLSHSKVIDAIAVHRTGSLKLGEIAVWVGVLSIHRKEAFDVCEHIINRIKKEVPIWKKEQYEDTSAKWLV